MTAPSAVSLPALPADSVTDVEQQSTSVRAAGRTLPRSGLGGIDSEAAMLQACLSRLDASLAVQDTKTTKGRKPQLVHLGGDTIIDVAHRGGMGTRRTDVADEDPREPMLVRTDATVAQGALQRLMAAVKGRSDDATTITGDASALQAQVAALQQELLATRSELDALREATDPDQTAEAHYTRYRSVWHAEHKAKQVGVERVVGGKDRLIELLLDTRRSARRGFRDVAARRREYEQTAAVLAELDTTDGGLFDEALAMFQPTAATVDTTSPRSAVGFESDRTPPPPQPAEFPAAAAGLDGTAPDAPLSDSDDGVVDTRGEEAIKQSGDIEEVLETLDDVLEGDTKKSRRRAEGSFPVDEIVITRVLRPVPLPDGTMPPMRSIRRLDPAGTYIGLLLDIFRFAPGRDIALALDKDSIVGQQAALTRQALVAGIADIWADIGDSPAPIVHITQCDMPSPDDICVEAARGPHITALPFLNETVDGTGTVEAEDPEARARRHEAIERILRFKRTAPATDNAASKPALQQRVVSGRLQVADDGGTTRTSKVAKGIFAALAVDAHGLPLDLAQAGVVRCYASSKLPTVTADALVHPYRDIRSPYFSTQDMPAQQVQISLRRVAVAPTAYSFACTHPVAAGYYPRSWRFEGSIDGTTWYLLSQHKNDETLTRYSPVGVWPLDPSLATFLPFWIHFRITQEGPNAMGTRHLNVSSIELFGRAMFVRDRQVAPLSTLPKNLPPRPKFEPLGEAPQMPKAKKKPGAKKAKR